MAKAISRTVLGPAYIHVNTMNPWVALAAAEVTRKRLVSPDSAGSIGNKKVVKPIKRNAHGRI